MSSRRRIFHTLASNRVFLEAYFSGIDNIFGDSILQIPALKIFEVINEDGKIGNLLDISIGLMGPQLNSVSGSNNITLLRSDDTSVMELRKWLDSHPEAFKWPQFSSRTVDSQEGSGDWEAKEMQLKKSIKQVLICNLDQPNLTDPVVLPPADCVISAWIPDIGSTNEEEYMSTQRKIWKLVKPGGLFILIGVVNGTYCRVGQDEVQIFKHDENYDNNALTKEGFTVIHSEVIEIKAVNEFINCDGMSFIVARKNK